jgi:hypothetical protein
MSSVCSLQFPKQLFTNSPADQFTGLLVFRPPASDLCVLSPQVVTLNPSLSTLHRSFAASSFRPLDLWSITPSGHTLHRFTDLPVFCPLTSDIWSLKHWSTELPLDRRLSFQRQHAVTNVPLVHRHGTSTKQLSLELFRKLKHSNCQLGSFQPLITDADNRRFFG